MDVAFGKCAPDELDRLAHAEAGGKPTSWSTAPTVSSRVRIARVASAESDRPSSGRRSPSITATAVDFPAPFGPSRATISPARSSRSNDVERPQRSERLGHARKEGDGGESGHGLFAHRCGDPRTA